MSYLRNDSLIYEDKKIKRISKLAKKRGFIPAEACGLQEDEILL